LLQKEAECQTSTILNTTTKSPKSGKHRNNAFQHRCSQCYYFVEITKINVDQTFCL